ncbi:hypothetical protein PsorP6_004689 [Peronosclerospora sorghi]|uniref:Uncharacterized protein n=1 Tax=Peronosclerospora sorghi TaxID=230839 RepID=A0ACC0VQA0_9STRA|nr:hypothetical protein PsorP6_004689 [Peronosclerospora sorghi]
MCCWMRSLWCNRTSLRSQMIKWSAPDAATFFTSQVQWLREFLEMETEAKWVVVTLDDVHDRMVAMTEVDGWQESKKKHSIALY